MRLKVINPNQTKRRLKRNPFQHNLNFQRRRHAIQADKVRRIVAWTLEVAAVVAAAFLLVNAFGITAVCAEASMEPNIAENDRVLMNRFSYLLSGPKAGDIVVFCPAGNVNAQYSMKRVIGVPGDKILIARGNIYVNGQVHRDLFDTEDIRDGGRAATEITLAEGEYFVLGDNRNNSEDSRYETIGDITRDEIVGKAWFVISPGNFGFVG